LTYPENFEDIIGFAQIREMITALCRYESSAQLTSEIYLLETEEKIQNTFTETDEWNVFQELHPNIALTGASKDISNWLPSLDIENFYFDESELLVIWEVLNTYSTIFPAIQKNREQFPVLYLLISGITDITSVKNHIQSVIDLKGKLLPFASAHFGKLNSEIDKMEKDTRQVVRNLFRIWKEAGYTAETDITVREERLVIPVMAEFKRKVNGFVKDVSATGKVIYIEPLESLELNNRLTELYAERRREREKILRLATAKLRPHKSNISDAMRVLAKLDFIRAKTTFANRVGAQRPVVLNQPGLHLKNAYNPLLWLKNKTTGNNTVAMNLELNSDKRIMVISGPNAGGKSISLKTAILLQYMGQCGLFITAAPESQIGLFRNLSIDCGDGQSIEDGLSTFSAHLQHLKKITAIAGKNSFFTMDELGDGTDPRFGGPIAQAVLEDLLKSGAFGIVTTHYSRLKEWATNMPGVVNASMAYDTRELKPLYQLITGKPGSSFALELMRKTGFENGVIERVKELSGEESGRTEELLMDLSSRQLELNDILEENKTKQAQLDLLLMEYGQLKEKINSRKKEILDAARNKASELLRNANKEIELTIRTIREHGANPEKTKKSRENLKAFELKKVNEKPLKSETKINSEPEENALLQKAEKVPEYKPGMWVRNLLNATKGEVLEVKKDKLLAVFGLLKMWVPISEIEPVLIETNVKKRKSVSGFDWVGRQAHFKTELDLRGIHADEALKKVQSWLDEAYALGQNSLKIIHGRGDGILRKTLREYFKTQNHVKSWRSETEQQGGDGCTLIELL